MMVEEEIEFGLRQDCNPDSESIWRARKEKKERIQERR